MSLPADFVFSQASLQDYVDCPRRFQLRYLLRVAWPTPVAEPIRLAEEHLQKGASFHRLVYQHLIGLPPELLTTTITDSQLRQWWEAYRQTPPPNLPAAIYPEITLSAPLAGRRLAAKYDVIAAAPESRLAIVDWKTNLRRPTRDWLERRLQTRVYRYVLAAAGQRFNRGQQVPPEIVEMTYWFANFPAQPERFRYDAAALAADEGYLGDLIGEIILRAADEALPMTDDTRRCRFCHYFSFCERGFGPADLTELEEEPEEGPAEIELDLDQIAEIEF